MNFTSKRYFGAALIVLALLPVLHGAELLSAQITYRQKSSVHEATVIENVPQTASRAHDPYVELIPVVEFVDDDGTRKIAQTNVASYPAPNAVGDQVSVRVHYTQAEDVRLVSFAGQWLESAFYLVPGLLTLGLGLLLVLKKSRASSV